MPEEIKIEPRVWKAAQEWAAQNAKRLCLAYGKEYPFHISLHAGTSSEEYTELYFESRDVSGREPRLWRAGFKFGNKVSVQWKLSEKGELPGSLEDVIEAGEIFARKHSWLVALSDDARAKRTQSIRNRLHQVLAAHPGFAEAYREILQRLFPPYEHHELHHADIEDYEESISIDDALLKRLSEK